MKKKFSMSLMGSILCACTTVSIAAESYTLEAIGLYDPQYLNWGSYNNKVTSLNEAGQVIGNTAMSGSYYQDHSAYLSIELSAWMYDGNSTQRIGYTGTDYTRDDGRQFSMVEQLNESGQVIGESTRYTGSSVTGKTAWIYESGTIQNIGLTGAGYVSDSGRQYSSVEKLNEAGWVVGSSAKYAGDVSMGSSVWLYNGTDTTSIGLTGADHTRDDGYQSSSTSKYNGINALGQVVGTSLRYNGATSLGDNAWFYNGSSTQVIGLTGVDHTSDVGYQNSNISRITDLGQVVGSSQRFNGRRPLGYNAWVFDGSNTQLVGLVDAEHTKSFGYQYSSAGTPNAAGKLVGSSDRFGSDDSDMGKSAWLYDGVTTKKLGLTGQDYTRDDGYKYSSASGWNGLTDQVFGTSKRYAGGSSNGQSVWVYKDDVTERIGLTDSFHTATFTNSSGSRDQQESTLRSNNSAGHAVGESDQYVPISSTGYFVGQSAWFYDGNDTKNIGLTTDDHVDGFGLSYSEVERLNQAGQATGFTRQNINSGQTAWFYDLATDTTYFNDFSVNPNNGYAFSESQYLGEDGLMLGNYEMFNGLGGLVGNYAFGFTVEDGFFDLGLKIEGGLYSYDWDYLASAFLANEVGQIVGYGELNGNDGAVYIATPTSVVPVPAAVWLFGSGLIGLIGLARRKKV